MLWCLCGHQLASELGDGYAVTPDQSKKWLRRKSDALTCPLCGKKYDLTGLRTLALTQKAS